MTTASGAGSHPGAASRRGRLTHLVALSALAVAGPVLDVLGANPTFFVAHGASPGEVAVAALLVVVVVPLVLGAVGLVVDLVSPRWGWRTHLVWVGLLATLVAANLLDDPLAAVIDDLPQVSAPLALVLSVAAGVAFTRLYGNRPMVRSTLSLLALVPLVFLAAFAFASPAHDLLFPRTVAAADLAGGGPRPDVVLVVLDELPLASVTTADGAAIDAARFPSLARLAADGTWYRQATAVAAYTHEAVPAILSGSRPADANLPPTVSGHPDTLFTLLADEYAITAHEQLTDLCPPTLCDDAAGQDTQLGLDVLTADLAVVGGRVALPALADDLLPEIDDTWAFFAQDPIALDVEADRVRRDRAGAVDDLAAADRVGRFEAAVAGLHRSSEPTLTFLHTVYPHVPWTHLPDGTPYPAVPNLGLEDNVWATTTAADLALQRHLLQAEHADALVGDLLDRLEELGTYDDALVVVTADHGAAFRPGAHRRAPEADTLTGLMPVPLLVKWPDGTRAGVVDDRQAQTVDVVPTIADLLEVDLPFAVDGRSLLGPEGDPVERGIYARGETVSAGTGPVDPAPLRERIWDRFGRAGRLVPTGLGPARALVGERARAHLADEGAEVDACWAPAADGEGRGYRWGRVHGGDGGEVLPVVLVVDGEVVGTTVPAGEDQEVLVLGDPTHWPVDAEVGLWQDTATGLVRLRPCP